MRAVTCRRDEGRDRLPGKGKPGRRSRPCDGASVCASPASAPISSYRRTQAYLMGRASAPHRAEASRSCRRYVAIAFRNECRHVSCFHVQCVDVGWSRRHGPWKAAVCRERGAGQGSDTPRRGRSNHTAVQSRLAAAVTGRAFRVGQRCAAARRTGSNPSSRGPGRRRLPGRYPTRDRKASTRWVVRRGLTRYLRLVR